MALLGHGPKQVTLGTLGSKISSNKDLPTLRGRVSKCPKVVWVVAPDGPVRRLPQARFKQRLEGPFVGTRSQASSFLTLLHIGSMWAALNHSYSLPAPVRDGTQEATVFKAPQVNAVTGG